MNVVEEYSARINVDYPIAYHADSSFLILKSSSKERWGSKWCVLSSIWECGSNGPGSYKLRLSSPRPSCPLDQAIFSLNNVHFCLERSWFDYEKFFYEWNPCGSDLVPVFNDQAILASWEIFVLVKEVWFSRQTISFRDILYSTLDPKASAFERISSIESIQKLDCFTQVQGVWHRDFLIPLKDKYLNWFEKFGSYARNKLLRQKQV